MRIIRIGLDLHDVEEAIHIINMNNLGFFVLRSIVSG